MEAWNASSIYFNSAYTLHPDALGEHGEWMLIAEVNNYFKCINYFKAQNGQQWAEGNLEFVIKASSFEALGSFLDTFGEFVQEWDYADI